MQRRGLILSEGITSSCLQHFDSKVSWVYDYGHRIKSVDAKNWINANQAEFVPMVHGFRVDSQPTPGGSYTSCFLTAAAAARQAGGVQCNAGLELTEQLGLLIPQFTKPVQYLSTINEPCALATPTRALAAA